jgi:ubiquinone/menaquinone biosynthesis C-methylase UbiE
MLKNGKEKIKEIGANSFISLTTGDAMLMPFRSNIFDVVMCGLATHHMDVPKLLHEIFRILKPDGRFSLGDVGGSKLWKFPLIQFFIKILAFFYFLFTENVDRAWAEAKAVTNVQTAESWEEILLESGYSNIKIQKLQSKKFWVPDPLIIQAQKPNHFPGEEES